MKRFIDFYWSITANLLIIRVILTAIDDGITRYILLLELSVGHHLKLFLVDALKENGCRFVGRILRHELAADGEVENLRARLGEKLVEFGLVVFDIIDKCEVVAKRFDNALLLREGREGNQRIHNDFFGYIWLCSANTLF